MCPRGTRGAEARPMVNTKTYIIRDNNNVYKDIISAAVQRLIAFLLLLRLVGRMS